MWTSAACARHGLQLQLPSPHPQVGAGARGIRNIDAERIETVNPLSCRHDCRATERQCSLMTHHSPRGASSRLLTSRQALDSPPVPIPDPRRFWDNEDIAWDVSDKDSWRLPKWATGATRASFPVPRAPASGFAAGCAPGSARTAGPLPAGARPALAVAPCQSVASTDSCCPLRSFFSRPGTERAGEQLREQSGHAEDRLHRRLPLRHGAPGRPRVLPATPARAGGSSPPDPVLSPLSPRRSR